MEAMRTIDANGDDVVPDYRLGTTVLDRVFVAHHDAREEVQEVWHYEDVRTFPNGGKIVDKVVDVPYSPATEAWDEYEDVLRYVPYTQAQLDEMAAMRAAEAEAARMAAEKEAFMSDAPERMGALESDSLDQDEAIAALYEENAQNGQTLIDLDETVVWIYETTMIGA